MSADLEDRLRDWVVWYTEHKKNIPQENFGKQVEFLKVAVDGVMELMLIMAGDLQKAERRGPRPSLWLPNSVRLDDGPPIKLR